MPEMFINIEYKGIDIKQNKNISIRLVIFNHHCAYITCIKQDYIIGLIPSINIYLASINYNLNLKIRFLITNIHYNLLIYSKTKMIYRKYEIKNMKPT